VIAALVAAVVALAVALAVAVGGLIKLALGWTGAEKRAGSEKAGHAELSVRLETMTEKHNDALARGDAEKVRADALDDALADAALNNAGPVDGALARLLQTWTRIRAKGGDGTRVLPTPAATVSPGPDDLLPFE
jgi:hypothetical protein